MNTQTDTLKPTVEILQRQLSELNSRARWYSSQAWQVPFAYLGISGAVLVGLVDKSLEFLGIALIAAGVLGGLVFIHILGILEGVRRAVEHIRILEIYVKLVPAVEDRPTTEYTAKFTTWSLLVAMILVILAYIGTGLVFFFKSAPLEKAINGL